MRCDECKYWNLVENKYSSNPEEIKLCNKPVALWDATQWEKPFEGKRKFKEEFKDLKMYVQDGSDYRAMLYTTADFFCYHFEKLE